MQLLRGVAVAAALMITVPVWAQAPTTADLNRQELNRVAAKTATPTVAAPAIGYSIVSPAPSPQVLVSPTPPQIPVPPALPPVLVFPTPPEALAPPAQPNFAAYTDRYPLPWLYRYYGYQAPATYEYISLGSGGHYVPIPGSPVPYWD